VIVDSSAIVAILRREAEEEEFKQHIGRARAKVSAVTLVETSIVVGPRRFEALDEFVSEAPLEVVAFDGRQAMLAREAHRRYGRKSGSPAKLNLGDCMAYALAKVTSEPLLFKGDDFTHTDITPAR
jgi:ribonuclease VapC